MYQWLITFPALLLWHSLGHAAPTQHGPYPFLSAQPVITIIMDDMGIDKARSRRALHISGTLTYAFLPYTRYGQELAAEAHDLNKEIILHLPMQPLDNRRLDQGVLTHQQDQQLFLATLRDNLKRIPHIRGVNNHMGSLLTQQAAPMRWLMQELTRQKNLFFIDSRTSPNSVGYQQAQQEGIPSLQRNVFLDNEINITAINRQFMQLLDIARRQGTAIAIAHPYPETLTYLENMLPTLPLLGIRLLPASQLIAHKARQRKPQRLTLQTAELKTIEKPRKASPLPPNLVR